MKKASRKTVWIREATHRRIKLLAAETQRKMTCDLLDELLEIGLRALERKEKNFCKKLPVKVITEKERGHADETDGTRKEGKGASGGFGIEGVGLA